jgi:hypothetical protein
MSTKTSPKPNAARKRKPSLADREAAQNVAESLAERVKKMSDAERRKLIAEWDKGKARRRYLLATSAPTAESAASDLLPVLQAIGLEFFRRYYPAANQISFHASCYGDKGLPEYSVMIPVPCDTKIPADAISQECPDWQTATLVLKDKAGKVVGYGQLKRQADGNAKLDISSAPDGVALLRSDG